ncbi:hypothetical protein I2I11_11895 [Pontibacter sp. 172403-2]|uniref:hypothetical protein n=1 Tax=Pontibacter rufus TaxID=2791028 RepID=UPI0018B00C82|nr:hypothetical protein [Pontibacter sp. 172403-2]MBF9253996.1 hypothetical protein [Pontibacter sp. 172403-2]
MKLTLPMIVVGLLWSFTAYGQHSLTVKEVKFDGIFGAAVNTSSNVQTIYCLLGLGYFLAPESDNIDVIIAKWIEDHPNARIIPVYTFGPIATDDKSSTMTYCWVSDKEENLNIWLVKQGCVHGQNLQYPTKEIKKQMGMDQLDNNSYERVHINDSEYQKFIQLAKDATTYAFENKLGIWKVK